MVTTPMRCWAALLAAAVLAACGAVSPEIVVRRGGFWADAYGFACECGAQTFQILGRPDIGAYRVRCPDCHREWVVRVESQR